MKKIPLLLLILIFALTACVSLKDVGSATSDLSIHDIQGCSHVSPYNGRSVSGVEGIVTWKIKDGFFMQESTSDDKDCSSEGIFVYTMDYPSVIPGDLVRVSGTVSEYVPGSDEDANLSVTEIKSGSYEVISSDNLLPEPVIIDTAGRLPPDKVIDDDEMTSFDINSDGLDFYESLEGMRVEIQSALVVESTNSYDEVFVIPTGYAAVNLISAEGALIATQADQNPERLLISLPEGFSKPIRQGDTLSGPVIGVLDYEYGNYRLLETNIPSIESRDSAVPEELSEPDQNQIRLATYNINNFNRFDEKKVRTLSEQIIDDLAAPDILVLQEVQDDSGTTDDGTTGASRNLNALIDQIHEDGDILYKYIDPDIIDNTNGGADGGNIRTVILYRMDRGLELEDVREDWSASDEKAFSNSRKPLCAEFSFNGRSFFVIGVHLVSNNLNTPLYGSIQPPEKPEEDKRIAQANWLTEQVTQVQRTFPDESFIITGDFNDTPDSSSLQTILSAGFVNLSELVSENERYSILYEGNASFFDQILISQDWQNAISDVKIIHLNTNEMENKQVSDHDPFVITINIQ